MSYEKNLGRVKGDTGKVYAPQAVTRNNKRYITWTLQDEGAPPEDINITPQVYMPSIDDNGNISFILTENTTNSIPPKNIKGAQGPAGAVDTVVCTNGLPPKEQANEGIIYIHDDGIATVFDKDTNDFYDLDNLLKFNNYLTTAEIQDNYYNKTQIDNMFGNVIACQQAIITLLDKDSIINIPSDD